MLHSLRYSLRRAEESLRTGSQWQDKAHHCEQQRCQLGDLPRCGHCYRLGCVTFLLRPSSWLRLFHPLLLALSLPHLLNPIAAFISRFLSRNTQMYPILEHVSSVYSEGSMDIESHSNAESWSHRQGEGRNSVPTVQLEGLQRLRRL